MKSYNQGTIIGLFVGGLFGIALTVGTAALASPGGPHGHGWTPEKMQQHVNEMIEKLDLSPAQAEQVRRIMSEAQTRRAEIEELPRGPEKFEAMRDLHFATEDQIYANLSCEQREQLRLLKREHKADRMQERWKHHHGENEE